MAQNLLNFVINTLTATTTDSVASTVTKSTSTNKTSNGLKSSIGSNVNYSLGEITDENSKYVASFVTATDPNINEVQALVDAARKTINPKLENSVIQSNLQSFAFAAGISSLQQKIPSLNSTIKSQFGNLEADQIARRVGYATNVSSSGISTATSNAINPLSNVLNSLSVDTPLINAIDSFQTLSNTNSPLGKISAGINLMNSAAQLSKSSPNDILTNAAGAVLQNVIGKNLNKTATNFTSAQNVKISNPKNWINPDVDNTITDFTSNMKNLYNTLDPTFDVFTNTLSDVGIPEKLGSDGSRKLGNPLREFSSYNYVISLGVLSPDQLNFPDTYVKEGKIGRLICKSGGGNLDSRQRTASEEALDRAGKKAHLEYFIDNLGIESVVSPNPNTGVSVGTAITFDIIEPYSMGQFLEAIRETANELNYGSFNKLPFVIKIEFTGYNVNGDTIPSKILPSYIPIMITSVDFDVDGAGSRYSCTAVAFTEIAFEDSVDTVLTDIKAKGTLAHEVLNTGEESVTAAVNALFENAEDNKLIRGYDRYLILFPKDSADIYDALKGLNITEQESLLFDQQEQNEINNIKYNNSLDVQEEARSGLTLNRSYSPSTKYYKNLKIWGSRPENINKIGMSPVADDVARRKNTMYKRQRTELRTDGPGQIDFQPEAVFGNEISYQYKQNSRISQIVIDVCLDTKYVQEAIDKNPAAGTKGYLKIDQMVFIEDKDDVNPDLGRPRMTYVYCVVPSLICESTVMGSQEAPKGIPERKASAEKEYNYIYSGKNEDVLDFSLNFNNAFYELVLSDYNKGSVSAGENTKILDRNQSQKLNTNFSRELNELTGASQLRTKYEEEFLNGAEKPTDPEELAKRNRAEQFHSDIINSPLNMVTAELTIWGDPYYIPRDAGNGRQKVVGKNLTLAGRADTRFHPLSIVINFKTPLDYPQLNGQFLMGMPELVKPFSGLFNCWGVTHTFNNGKFTQNLQLQRVQNQTNTPTGTFSQSSTAFTKSKIEKYNRDGTIRGGF